MSDPGCADTDVMLLPDGSAAAGDETERIVARPAATSAKPVAQR
jgi:hypothetical protein